MKNSRTAQNILDNYRETISPSSSTRERLMGEFSQRLMRGDLPNTQVDVPQPLPPPTASLATVGLSPTVVAAVVIGTSVALLAAAWWWREHERQAPQQNPIRIPAGATDVERPTSVRIQQTESATPPQGNPGVVDDQPASVTKPNSRKASPTHGTRSKPARKRGDRKVIGRRDRVPATASAATISKSTSEAAPLPTKTTRNDGDLEEELRLMRDANNALRANKPQTALVLLAEHESRFPRGTLADSRRVARIMALCQAGKVAAARTEAERFLRRAPNSPYAARVRSLCTEPGTPPSR